MAEKASQDFVPIKAVRDGVVVMKDGSLRAVLMASSINFALKSEDEQQAVIAQFQNFLNSLEFSVQVFIQSRELDIRPYVALLEGQLENTLDDLMRIQIREYIAFVKNFTEAANIMTKNFFIVVPYQPALIGTPSNIISGLLDRKKKSASVRQEERDISFAEHVSQLEQRVGVVEQGLVRSGVRVAQLGTEEAIELLYKIFNPGEQEKPISIAQQQQQ